MRTFYLPLSFAGVTLLGLVGCASPVGASNESADAEASSAAAAVVVVERTAGPGDGARAEAVARFVQMRSGTVDDQALRMVGAAVDFPTRDACSTVDRAWGAHARPVKLADVGVVSLEANGVKTSLVARQVPDVADLVSGVLYTARGESALVPRTRYVLRSSGNAEVEPFEVTALAPAELDVRVAGQDGREPVALAPDRNIDIAWDTDGAADDVVYVDIASSDAATPIVRCLFSDAGRATIPAAAWGTIDAGTLSVHRLHREPFRARGLEGGEIRFDFARATPFTRR
jgi:hypothetical protein